jgi:nitrogen fixation protein NifB
VLIPGLNDRHLVEVNQVVRGHGAFLHNVMPLLSDPAHGTVFGLSGQRGPSAAELKGLQDQLGGDAKLMKHCRQCRADAVGLLGQDVSQEFTLERLDEQAPAATAEGDAQRQAYRDHVERERADRDQAARQAERTLGARVDRAALLLAVCTKGGGRINQHFGHASEFQIYEVDRAGIRFIGHRRADHYCQGGYGEDDKLEAVIKTLAGVSGVLCAKIGSCPSDRLKQAGITVFTDYAYDYIETAVGAVYRSGFDQAGGECGTPSAQAS